MMVPTPNNSAQKDDIAGVVLMPGDPLRSKWIAETFFDDPRLVNNIRGVQGYTGTWNGHRVSVMASGIGIPSISLYVHELFNFYDVDMIIRTGTCGSITDGVNVGDIIIPGQAFTTSNFGELLGLPADTVYAPDRSLFEKALKAAGEAAGGKKVHTGPVLTEDLYYTTEGFVNEWAQKGVLAFEMEAAALFAHARLAGKKALAVLTVSNSITEGTEMHPDERERFLNEMVETALKAAFDE